MSEIYGMRLRVKTEELLIVADEVANQIRTLRQQTSEIDHIIERSSIYWEGNGQTSYSQAYRSKRDMMEEALHQFSENVTDLRTIAGVYTSTEQAAAETADSLACDVIV